MTVNGQTVQVSPNGSFAVSNVAAPDLFGLGGPGTAPDFLSDDFVRVSGVCTSGGVPVYVLSDCFRITQGQTFQVGQLTFSNTPPLVIDSILAAPATATLTAIGQTTPIVVTATLADGSMVIVDPGQVCGTYRTSKPAIVSVNQSGLATANSAGTALITATAEGATSVTAVTVSVGDPLTTVVGIVQREDGTLVPNASVNLVNLGGSTVTAADGSFSIAGAATQPGPITVLAQATIDNVTYFGAATLVPPFPGGFTDAGIITLANDVVWVASTSGSWHTGSNWSIGVPPGANQDAFINVIQDITVTHSTGSTTIDSLHSNEAFVLSGGSLSLGLASEVDNTLAMTGGTLGGAGQVSVGGLLNWSAGSMLGPGTTNANGGLTIGSSSHTFLTARTLNNNGTATWIGSGGFWIQCSNAAVINNPAGSLFDVQNDTIMSGASGATFNNAGTFRKSAGSGTTTIGPAFNNGGLVEVNSGTLLLTGAGSSSTGAFNVPTGATLEFGGGGTHTLQAGSQVNAAGIVRFAGVPATVNVAGSYDITGTTVILGTANFNSSASTQVLTLTGASSNLGGSGIFTVNGPLTWTAGAIVGPGTTNANGGLSIGSSAHTYLVARTLNNNGTATWMGSGGFSIKCSDAAVINNPAGSLFDVQNDTTMNWDGGAQPTFNNAGTFRKSAGSGTTTIGPAFNNSGLVEVNSGTLSLAGAGSSSTGVFNVPGGSTLEFGGSGTHTLQVSSQVNAAGTVRFAGVPATVNVAGSYDITGTTAILGTANFNSPASTQVLTLTGGSSNLGGSGTFTVNGPLTWTAGAMVGTSTTNANGGLTIGSSSHTFLNARTLNNNGTATWMGSGGFSIKCSDAAVINNPAGSLFDVQNDTTMSWDGGAQPTFNNAGTFRKSAGSGTTTIGPAFNNSGLVEVNSGTLSLAGAGSSSTGAFNVPTGATLEFGGGGTHTLQAGSQVNAAGTVRFAGTPATVNVAGSYDITGTTVILGTANFNSPASTQVLTLTGASSNLGGSGIFTVNGLLTWTAGAMLGPGTTNANGGLTIGSSSHTFLNARTLNNNGLATWIGSAGFSIQCSNAAVFSNPAGSLFDVQNDTTMSWAAGAQPTFNNAGTFRKSAGTGTTTISPAFNNTGVVQVQTGKVLFGTTFTQTTGQTALEGATTMIQTASAGAALSIQGGELTGNGTVIGSISNTGGQVAPGLGVGKLTMTGTSYTQNAGGTLKIQMGGLAQDTQYDRLAINGNAALGGMLELTLVNGFVPNVGDTFQILTATGTLSGTFSLVTPTNFPSGLGVNLTYAGGAVTVQVVTN